ncbi:MAG: type II toxin-antitoxin system Phd/YefM family antitoxin [Actinomycetales bacterium]
MYPSRVDVAVSRLRAELAVWIERAQSGEDIVVTERGKPVARLVGVDSAPLLERLARQGVIRPPQSPTRPTATGAPRARTRQPVSDLVTEQRR